MRFILPALLIGLGGQAAAAPRLSVPVTSSDRIGVKLGQAEPGGRGRAAAIGMWSADGALEIAGFQNHEKHADPTVAHRRLRSRGLRLSGSFYRSGRPQERGWTLAVDARRQRLADVGANLAAPPRSLNDSRLTLGGRFRF